MKKYIAVIVSCIMIVGLVSAGALDFLFGNEIDIDYKDDNMTIEFKENDLVIGKAVLKSHNTYNETKKVTTGKNRTIIWYEFLDFKDIQLDALKGVEFIDMREFIVNESKEYKEFEEMEIIENPDYLNSIEKEYKFVYKNGNEWLDYNTFDIPKENIIIGIQTDLFWGELVDVRLNILDNELDRHALVMGTNAGFVTEAPDGDPEGFTGSWFDQSSATKDTTPATATTITEIGWYADNAAADANFEVGIYEHDSGDDEPDTLLAGSSRTNAKGTGSGWIRVTGLNIEVTAERTYWIAVQLDEAVEITSSNFGSVGGARMAFKTFTTTLPTPWGDGSAMDSFAWAIYAVWGTGEEPPEDCWTEETWGIFIPDGCVYEILSGEVG